jgi:hypothetical protein
MPIHIIVAAPTSGGAGRSASHALAHAASVQGLPTLLLEVPRVARERTRPALVASLALDPEAAARAIAERNRSDIVVAYVEQLDADFLRCLLPLADTITVAGDRTGNLDQAACLYGAVAAFEIATASGRALEPWLLPSGWPCNRNPGVRLRGWQAQLERRTFPGRLRCLPLIFPWSDLDSLGRADRQRVEAIGTRLLAHLTAIAAGRAPDRPAGGLADGDPWPDLPPPAPVVRLSGLRPRLHLLQGM